MLESGIKEGQNSTNYQWKHKNTTRSILICDECKNQFLGSKYQKSNAKNNINIYCSHVCYKKHMSNIQLGKNNNFYGKTHTNKVINNIKKANFKTGKSIIGGYLIINPVRGKTKAIREHRLIMENHIGRKLLDKEHIHHIDGNKLNNSIDNLMIVSPAEHIKLHILLPKKLIGE